MDESKLFPVLRALGEIRDRYARRAAALAPPPGSLPVGSAHFDEELKVWAIEEMQRALRAGKSPDDATNIAKDESRRAIQIWNARREYQVQRYVNAIDPFLDHLRKNLLAPLDS